MPAGTPLPDRPIFTIGLATDPDERPFRVRRNVALERYAGHPDFPHRVGVTVLGTDTTATALSRLEDELVATCTRRGENVLALVLTAPGYLEFVFYSRAPTAALQRCREVADRFPEAGLQAYAERDPRWAIYRELVR